MAPQGLHGELGRGERGHWLSEGLSSLRPSPPGDPSQDLPCSLPTGHQMARLPHQVHTKPVGKAWVTAEPGAPSALPCPSQPRGSLTPAAWRVPLLPTPIFSFPSSRGSSVHPSLLAHPCPPARTLPLPLPAPHPQGFPGEEGEGGRETDGGRTGR